MNILGYVAENILKDDIRLINYDKFYNYLLTEKATPVDVRIKTEFEKSEIPNAINMDVDSLKDN